MLVKYIHRLLFDKIKIGFRNNRIIIITGSRQVGKTTLMKMYINSIPKSYKYFYFNLEDINNLHICQNIENLQSYLRDAGYDIEKNKIFLIIDEFHYIKNATKLFKIIYDNFPLVKILASGSSSVEIQKHLKESLAGRKRLYHLYPLSLEEYIRFKNSKECDRYVKLGFLDVSTVSVEMFNRDFLRDYIVSGSYPKVSLLKNKTEKIEEIEDIYNSYIQKDIRSLVRGENISSYNNLLRILSSQIGNLLNINELSNTLGMSRRVVMKYLNILEETFIIKRVPPFFVNKRSEISKMPKLYFMDSGIVNISSGNFSVLDSRPNKGSFIENFILCEIMKYKPVEYRLYFWRTKLGTEIDFILSGGDELIPVEVKWKNVTHPYVPKNFISFFNNHPNVKKAVVVNRNLCRQIKFKNKNIYYIPAVLFCKFLKKLSKIDFS